MSMMQEVLPLNVEVRILRDSGYFQPATIFLWWCVTVLVCLPTVPASAQNSTVNGTSDVDIMREIRQELSSRPENYNILAYWDASLDPCSWTKVICYSVIIPPTSSSPQFFVVKIEIPSLNLTGPVPSTIGRLQALTFIDATNNRFTSVPPSVCNHVLEWAYFSGNQLSGNLSDILHLFGLCAQLKELRLDDNFLEGSTDSITELKSPFIEKLSLTGNKLTGDLTEFSQLPWIQQRILTDIDLSDNQFHCAGPINLSASVGFQRLSLGGNQLNCRLGGFPNNAVFLNLSHNKFSGSLKDMKYDSLQHTEQLLLNNNRFSGPIPKGLLSLQKASTVDLSSNQLSGIVIGVFMPDLRVLNLSNNQLSGSIHVSIAELARDYQLRVIDLSDNNFSGTLPPEFPHGEGYNYSFSGNPGLCSINKQFRKQHRLHQCSAPDRRPLWAGVGSTVSLLVLLTGGGFSLWWRRLLLNNTMDVDLEAAVSRGEITTRLICLRDLQRATGKFAEQAKIGEGGFGTVYKGLYDGKEVAIKMSSKGAMRMQERKQMFMNEVQILSTVHHRHLVSIIGCCMTPEHALLVFEYVSQGTLKEHLHGQRGHGLDWSQRLKIARQTAEALNYLHSAANPPIYHRDVKTANILLDDRLNAKVADFGVSKVAANLDVTHLTTLALHGTPGYIDPEFYMTFQMTGKSDVYSFGVVLLELITCKAPLDHTRGEDDSNLAIMASNLMKTDRVHLFVDPTLMIWFENVEDVRLSILDVAQLALRCTHRESVDRPDMKQVESGGECRHTFGSVEYHRPPCLSCFLDLPTESTSNDGIISPTEGIISLLVNDAFSEGMENLHTPPSRVTSVQTTSFRGCRS